MVSFKLADWSLLPSDLLISVAEKLLVADIVRLRVVCTRWAWSLGRPHNGLPTPPRYRASFVPIPPSVPWMLLPSENSEDADFCSFLDLSNGQVRRISHVPEMVSRRCVGASPDGWLVTLDLELNPRVLNPLTREELPLPSLLSLFPTSANIRIVREDSDGSLIGFVHKGTYLSGIYLTKAEFRDEFILKIVLTSAPPFGIAAAIFGCKPLTSQLALARVGDASWTPVPVTDEAHSKPLHVEDVLYDKENCKLYIVTSAGSVFFINIHVNNWPSGIQMPLAHFTMKPRLFASPSDKKQHFHDIGLSRHLIFSSDRLLQICRSVEEYTEREVHRLREGLPPDYEEDEDDDSGSQVVKVETIGVRIMKFDPMMKQPGKSPSWIPANANDLDNQAIFVGCNHPFSLPATIRPGLRKNSVYFTETSRYDSTGWRRHIRDAAVFDVATGAFQRFFSSDAQVNWPPPVWFMPSQLHFEILS